MMFFSSKGYRVVAHDRRGHGRSSPSATGNDMDTMRPTSLLSRSISACAMPSMCVRFPQLPETPLSFGRVDFGTHDHARYAKSRETTCDNFMRDFGERYVPGYKAPSWVDRILNGPYSAQLNFLEQSR